MEIKLTQVARASLEELKLDYEDFLRQRGLEQWERDNPLRQELVDLRPETADEVADWVRVVHDRGLGSGPRGQRGQRGQRGRSSQHSSVSSESSVSSSSTSPGQYSEIAANAALALINVACYLLDKQIDRLAADFENDGGFTERLYRTRTGRRNQ